MNAKKVKHDALDAMWAFLQMGGQQADVPTLREHCKILQHMMMQKTAGQRTNKTSDVSFDELDAVCNTIVVEAMALYLSGELDKMIADSDSKIITDQEE